MTTKPSSDSRPSSKQKSRRIWCENSSLLSSAAMTLFRYLIFQRGTQDLSQGNSLKGQDIEIKIETMITSRRLIS